MPVQVSYPGVYVQEVSSGVRTITGVSTSVAMFVGMTTRGRLGVPTRVLSFADYQRTFGNDTQISEMTDQVRQFFQNGGQRAWITRIADGALPAEVTLRNAERNADALAVAATDAGLDGNMVRVEVDYATPTPESTFNLRVFRERVNDFGELEVEVEESFPDLSPNPAHGRFVETVLEQQSILIHAQALDGANLFAGYSISGRVIEGDDATVETDINEVLTNGDRIQISVDGSPLRTVTLESLTGLDFSPWVTAIENALNAFDVGINVGFVNDADGRRYLRFQSTEAAGGRVRIAPAPTNDAAVMLQLGTAQGGLEVDGFAERRPAPSGYFATLGDIGSGDPSALLRFAAAQKTDLTHWNLTDDSGEDHSGENRPVTFAGAGRMFAGSIPAPPSTTVFVGSLRNVRENLTTLASSIESLTNGVWQAAVHGFRLVLTPTYGDVNSDTSASISSTPTYDLDGAGEMMATAAPANVRAYSLGDTGALNYQTPGTPGDNGARPGPTDYQAAYGAIDSEVDLFNLLVLPRCADQNDGHREELWGPASSFCQRRRAFLLLDPRSTWADVNDVDAEIDDLRVGVVTDHAALYWPRVRIAGDETTRIIDASGSVAGLMARTDANRGVWKAPAGLEADVRSVRGVEHLISDPENGVINPRAANALRVFPNGIVVWGARTLGGFDNSGNDDYKYVPVRRLALFIEESLYRGLKFAVFEPNDEPLWAQIRLAGGAFMNNLFRQGAFQGQKASEAYFVKCDSETTTQNDINLGIVNVVVAFAPLKPAEFVVITLRQLAGQVQV